MARKRADGAHYRKPWKAEVKLDGLSFFLGYHPTKDDAERLERAFRVQHLGRPNARPGPRQR